MNFRPILQGALMGIGNIIPGVSGATIALILGIYKRLIDAINSLNIATPMRLLSGKKSFKEELKRIDFWFLAMIFLGTLSSVYAFSFIISYFLEVHHDATYSFFFGLIIASTIIPMKYIHKKTWYGWGLAILAAILVVFISLGVSENDKIAKEQMKINIKSNINTMNVDYTYTQLGYYALVGAIAISAMILPGISGSFILLLLGSYFDILIAIKKLDFPILGSFGFGCLFGLIFFAKLVKYLLDRYESEIMFFLMGLIVGSLYSIWPFRNQISWDKTVIYGDNILPDIFTLNFATCVVCMFLGMALVLGFLWYERKYK